MTDLRVDSERRRNRTKYRLAVIEDQPLFLQMMSMLLSSVPSFEVAGAYSDARSAGTLDATAIDVALIDLRLPDGDGLSLGRALRQRNPNLGIVLLSASDSVHALLELPGAEARGWSYLSKTSSLSAQALVRAIRHTAHGRTVIDPAVQRARHTRDDGPLAALSRRQREVLALVAEGLTNAAIAAQLGISPRSVDAHLDAIYTALEIRSVPGHNPRVDAVRAFIANTTPAAGHTP